jgi:hypothetical protein
MRKNVGNIDRLLRIILGGSLAAAAAFGYVGPWGWIGLATVATGIVCVCPAYIPLGLSSCRADAAIAKD